MRAARNSALDRRLEEGGMMDDKDETGVLNDYSPKAMQATQENRGKLINKRMGSS